MFQRLELIFFLQGTDIVEIGFLDPFYDCATTTYRQSKNEIHDLTGKGLKQLSSIILKLIKTVWNISNQSQK